MNTSLLALPPSSLNSAPKPQILLIDDSAFVLKVNAAVLAYYGYKSMNFESPSKAYSDFSKNPAGFSCVVTDLNMPVLSGLELIRSLRRITPDLPAILYTGSLTPAVLREAAEIGDVVCVMKPAATEVIEALARLTPSHNIFQRQAE